ncbi:uncharacterized protein LOC102801908 [Saccoglossus kowalevskii]|uniref:Zinc finger protein 568-like n=1 Tax=Saccoglossus kowalevskii TaxID=10224 RepID=A0ABM0MHT4_SACKO|nr:PREDICTED: zinc finger protein 568-like [Saccoglossus kowalevskii]
MNKIWIQKNEKGSQTAVNHEQIYNGGKSYPCRHCKMVFTCKSDLSCHKRIHTGELPYICKVCGTGFSDKGNLTYHEQTHADGKQYKCIYCNKEFTKKAILIQHERCHTGEKPFICTHCQKAFCQKSHLISHNRIHTGEKPYQCTYCEKRFSQTSNLRCHEKLHLVPKPEGVNRKANNNQQMKTHEKPYKCKYCKKAFRQKVNLTTHERTHTGEKPFQCKLCGKSFNQKATLTYHERIHTGLKPYKCTHCQRGFSQKSHLIAHVRTHTSEKPFQCTHCGRAFTQKGTLTVHEKIHTRDKPYKCKKDRITNNKCSNGVRKQSTEKVHTGTPSQSKRLADNKIKCHVENSNRNTGSLKMIAQPSQKSYVANGQSAIRCCPYTSCLERVSKRPGVIDQGDMMKLSTGNVTAEDKDPCALLKIIKMGDHIDSKSSSSKHKKKKKKSKRKKQELHMSPRNTLVVQHSKQSTMNCHPVSFTSTTLDTATVIHEQRSSREGRKVHKAYLCKKQKAINRVFTHCSIRNDSSHSLSDESTKYCYINDLQNQSSSKKNPQCQNYGMMHLKIELELFWKVWVQTFMRNIIIL